MEPRAVELLAPAGSRGALQAALASGANAVYLGLSTLNARRGADNFSQDDLVNAVRLAHEKRARVFLTLNIDVAPREVGMAARALELARRCGVDAVLVEDPAFLAFQPEYPELEFHFSTQAAVTNSAGVLAAKDLGIRRVVLAREMSLAEIRAASSVDGVETEVFVHGALCLCVSGRCLFSSWGGGRSGNRGACTSPCRVRWSVGGKDAGYLLSMNDLCLVGKLTDLVDAGVSCFKIEGRLKNADWVGKAVALYRRALAGETVTPSDAAALGDYAGRQLGEGYLDGTHREILGESARPAFTATSSATASADTAATSGTPSSSRPEQDTDTSPGQQAECGLQILAAGGQIECRFTSPQGTETWYFPKSSVKHENRGMTLEQTVDWLRGLETRPAVLTSVSTDSPEQLVPRKTVNHIADAVTSAMNRLGRGKKSKEKRIDIELPAPVRSLTEPMRPSLANNLHLGQKPNKARIEARAALAFLAHARVDTLVVDEAAEADLDALIENAGEMRLVIALPTVFFEDELPKVRALAEACARRNLELEVNGWDGWRIARDAGARFEGGPGMAVLNPLAARVLQEKGFSSVWYSPEADHGQLEDLAARCPAPATLAVFARPVLVYTRAPLPDGATDEAELGDSRGIHVRVLRKQPVTRLRTLEPYCLAHVANAWVRAKWLCADLTGSPAPLREWDDLQRRRKLGMPFNYERGLY